MAGKGKRFFFHGAFKSKAAAKRKEKRGKKFFILKVKIKGRTRFDVLSRRKRGRR